MQAVLFCKSKAEAVLACCEQVWAKIERAKPGMYTCHPALSVLLCLVLELTCALQNYVFKRFLVLVFDKSADPGTGSGHRIFLISREKQNEQKETFTVLGAKADGK